MPSVAIDRNIGSARNREDGITAKERAVKIRDDLVRKADRRPIEEVVRKKLWCIMEKDANSNDVKLPVHK